MHVNVIIPTHDRLKLLMETIKSIQESKYKDVSIFVIIDGNLDLLPPLLNEDVGLFINKKRRDWVYSMNTAIRHTAGDATIYASDDLIFSKQCIGLAVHALKAKAPDGDGLVAINQDVRGCTTAFGLMGRKFVERFPGRQVFCPDYIHFGSDAELGRFVRSIGKLIIAPGADVIHRRLNDPTHKLAKRVEQQDFAIIAERREKGYLWGKNFGRIK
jgi:glycosyltransferase involved in cell wall biosynthesis